MIFLSSGVAMQNRIAHDDLIALLLYGFSNLRYYKHKRYLIFWYINDNFKFWTSFLSPIPRRKMNFSTNFAAMLSLVGRIKFSLNCFPSLELRDITHAQFTYTHLFTGRISKLGLHSLQSYGCVRITSLITRRKNAIKTKVIFVLYSRTQCHSMSRGFLRQNVICKLSRRLLPITAT